MKFTLLGYANASGLEYLLDKGSRDAEDLYAQAFFSKRANGPLR